ncbi:MAG TPA: outer membrane beta-barrel protein [Xanthobacteraceae bacterium]|nr:outer membrane beta-barrel protein [Xanthobacteraceae bacterium]
MKKFVVGCALFAALAVGTPAIAADLPPAPPVYKAPVIAPVIYDWTGFYVGGNVGYSWGEWDSTNVGGIPTFPGSPTALGTTASPGVNGLVAGGQAGYNWQFNPKWVVGIEGDLNWSGERASDSGSLSLTGIPTGIGVGACDAHPPCLASIATTTTNNWSLPWFATLRARLGYVPEPTWLLYATGGLALGEMEFSTSNTTTTTITNGIGQVVTPTGSLVGAGPITTAAAFSESITRAGFAVGGGVEKMLTQNWTVKAEYLYLDWGSYTFLSGTGYDTNVRLRDNIVRIGVNYKFGGPVVAKY